MKKTFNLVKNFLYSQWNKKEFSRDIFPFISEDFANSYFIPIRSRPHNGPYLTLASLFQDVWSKILRKESGKLEIAPDWIGADLLTIAKKYVQEDKNETMFLCEGLLEDVSFNLRVTPSPEPTVYLTLSVQDIEVQLGCTQWDMNYRPLGWEHKSCWFSLESERYEKLDGKRKSIERLSLWNAEFFYEGKVFFGNTLHEESYVCEVGYDKFTTGRSEHVLKSSGPFLKKMNEHLVFFGIQIRMSPLRD